MLKLKVDIMRTDNTIRTFYGWARFEDLETAIDAEKAMHDRIWDWLVKGRKFRAFRIEIINANN